MDQWLHAAQHPQIDVHLALEWSEFYMGARLQPSKEKQSIKTFHVMNYVINKQGQIQGEEGDCPTFVCIFLGISITTQFISCCLL